MTDLSAFLRGIRSKPDDDVRRLAFADWLDERGDPAWAEFVRLQCEIEPVRGRYDLPGVFANEKRERELLRANEKRWLAPGDGLPAGENPSIPRFGFRRGVVEIVRMSGADWLEHGEAVLVAFPTVRELVVFHARGAGRELGRSDQLRHLDGLEIADWVTPDDAGELCRATVPELRTLRTRIGTDVRTESNIVMEIHNSGAFRDLQTWEIVQLYGGVAAGDGAPELALQADEFTEAANGLFEGSPDVRVVRPFEQLFPLGPRDGDGDVGYGLTAGRLRKTTPALIHAWDNDLNEFDLFTFGRNGRFSRATSRDYAAHGEGEAWDEQIPKKLRFKPGPIAVREFRVPDRHFGVQLFDEMDHTLLVNPDLPDGPVRREALEHLVWWLARGNFVIRKGRQKFWADRGGDIHSS